MPGSGSGLHRKDAFLRPADVLHQFFANWHPWRCSSPPVQLSSRTCWADHLWHGTTATLRLLLQRMQRGMCARWCVQESLADTGERPLAAPRIRDVAGAADIVNVDGEMSLIVVRASGGSATAQVAEAHVAACVGVGSFEVEDLLVGPRCPAMAYLARSFEIGAPCAPL